MHRPIFGRSFAVLVAPILVSVIVFNFLNKKKASARRNAKDADAGASANSGGSSSFPVETIDGASCSSPTETDNGASSSSTASIGNRYEVFLSFRGPDTRRGFTDHLYNGLLDAGIDVFRDDDELPQGENIRPELLAAIKKSKILIPILSENYGTSGWCLDELVQIMECKKNNGQIVLPVFYKVKPADVRHQIGSFGDALLERERRLRARSSFDPTISEKWKKALDEVSTLKGYEADGYEGELVKSIVQKVLIELKKKFGLVIPENLVGIDGHVEKVMEFVDNNSTATLFVGIYGMGGIGKTTLAKTIYNKLSNRFKDRSFIADVRESYRRNGLLCLQNQLISDLKQNNQVSNKDEGIKFISSKFKDKKVLILVDDVDDHDQLKALVGDRNWFSSGSRILITTRDSSILDNVGVDYKYEHGEMDENHSKILFSRHAFRRSSPPIEFEALTRDVVATTGRLPLSLEVLGSFLCGKELTFWRATIDKIKKFPHQKVREKLRISYEELDHRQKQIFLDIACFFIGADRRIVSYMWDASGFFPGEGIEVLRFMSLIKIGDDHRLQMHDQLRDLGREIVHEENQREPQYRSRLWEYEEVQKVLKGNKGTDKIEALDLSKGGSEDSSEDSDEIAERDGDIYTEKQFKNLTSLRFLFLEGPCLNGDFEDSMNELKWLRWPNCPLNFEVKNFHLKELAVLEMSRSKINGEWKGWSSFMMAEKLKFLDLSESGNLENTDFLSAFKNLEVLILTRCWSLQRIDSSIGDMKALLRLELSWCERLRELPAEIGKLKALEQLLLRETRALYALPESIGSLENLEILDISWSGIKRLPDGIGRLTKLRELDAYACENLRGEMPESMCNLSSLQYLNVSRCSKLQLLSDLPSSLTYLGVTCQSHELPSLSYLTHLEGLQVCNCRSLKCIQALPSKLPESLNTTSKLKTLRLHGCDSIQTLDVSQFMNLRELSVDYCSILLEVRGLDKLIYLEELGVTQCGFKRLDLPKFGCLKTLKLHCCDELVEIQGLDGLEFLESLDISDCTSIERLLLPKSGSLQTLYAEGCKNLAEIEGLDTLELHIKECTSIERLDLSKSGRLKKLKAEGCKNLAEIQDLDRLEFLESLDIFRCTSIEKLLLPKSRILETLHVKNCQNLAKIEGLDILELHIQQCTSIERLDLSKSRRLKELKAEDCGNLAEIQDLDKLESLESLKIYSCTSIKRLLLPKSGSLKILYAKFCENLAKIEGLDTLELHIQQCTSIERLDLSKCGRLKESKGCKDLAEIQDLDRLEFLESLDITGCTSIERLDLSKCGKMKELYAGYCVNLAEIHGLDRLKFLESLNLFGCTLIERLNLPKFGRLEELFSQYCENLAEIQGLDTLEFLEFLNITSCTLIQRLDLPKSKRLKKVDARDCKNLAKIEGLDSLEFLEELDIKGCTSIKRLDLPKFGSMKILNAGDCENLAEIQGLDSLEFLECLNINGCTSIEKLLLPKQGSLKVLYATSCKKLAKIQGLNKLEFLEILYIEECTSIKRLDLSNSGRLKELNVGGCKNLTKIQGLNRLEFLEKLYIEGCTSIERLDLPKSGRLKRFES